MRKIMPNDVFKPKIHCKISISWSDDGNAKDEVCTILVALDDMMVSIRGRVEGCAVVSTSLSRGNHG